MTERPFMRRAAAPAARAAAMAIVVVACSSGSSGKTGAPAGRVGSSIVVIDEGAHVAVLDRDQGSVSILDATTLDAIARIDVGDEPRAMIDVQGRLYVTTHRGGEIVVVDERAMKVVARATVCAGAWGLASSSDEAQLAVACEWEQRVVRLDRSSLVPLQSAPMHRPSAVAFDGDDLIALEYVGGHAVRVRRDGAQSSFSLVPQHAPYRPALTTMTANLASSIVPAFGTFHVTHLLENHDGDGSQEKIADDYGSVVDGNPKINPALTSLDRNTPVLYAKFDGASRVFNGPIASAPFGDRFLLVVNVSSDDVTVIDTTASDPTERVFGSVGVGAGPHGIAVDAKANVAFVDNTFDHSVSRIDLSNKTFAPNAPRYDADLTRVRDLPRVYSPAALAGRKLFYDAKNTHVTPSAVVVCATCHPDGGDDGLVWFIHTAKIGLKRRRTPDLGNAHSGEAPFHWNGEFKTMHDLAESTMTDLMAGDGLLVDLDSITAYVDEIVRPPILPATDADAVTRGMAIFQGVSRCATCHSGADFTDGALHAPLDPMSLSADDVFTQANTPSLHGAFLRAPYFHDGRSPDLHDLLTRADAAKHGGVAGLSAQQLDDLIAYVRSL